MRAKVDAPANRGTVLPSTGPTGRELSSLIVALLPCSVSGCWGKPLTSRAPASSASQARGCSPGTHSSRLAAEAAGDNHQRRRPEGGHRQVPQPDLRSEGGPRRTRWVRRPTKPPGEGDRPGPEP